MKRVKIEYILIIVFFLLCALIGWLIPIDGPFDIKPEEVIEQYEQTHRYKCCSAPAIRTTRVLTPEELEILEEEYGILQNKESEE